MLTFYFAPGSSSMAPHIALHEVGAQFEARPISLKRKEQREPSYLAINPEGKVPTLLIDGKPLTEVAGILYYLARRFPEAELFPEGDAEGSAQVISWMSFVASTVHPSRREGPEAMKQAWALAEQKLGTKEWGVDRYSIADIHLFRLFWRIKRARKEIADTCPNLTRHYEQMMKRPAVQKTIAAEEAIGYELPG